MMAAAHLHFTNPENPDYADAVRKLVAQFG